ncbi:MAG TPA: serine hydrolase [Gemmatimonadales bacterium]|nr:serine hydrolase [Gemmatimonadales bacterium]
MLRLALPVLIATQGPRPAPETIVRAVDSLATRIVAANLTPALGVALVMDGKTVFSKAYGLADVGKRIPADARTLWYLASTSKSYTGFGISLLAQQGVLRFDQSIASLLPGTTWHAGVDPNQLTLAQFLSHTHHLNDNAIVQSAAFTGEIPEARWPELLRLAEPTGNTDLVYSNFGYNVAAMVIDAKRKEGWRRFLDSAVYAPAGMRDTHTKLSGLDPRRIAMPHTLKADGSFSTAPFFKTDATMNSAGGHVATLHDLARWIAVQMDDGMLDGKRVFPAEAVALSHRMIAPHTVAQSKRFAYFDREGWGAGWDIGSYEGEPMVSRFGSYSTTRSHVSMLPRRRIGVVAQVNGSPGAVATDLIAAYAYDLEAGKPNAREVMERRFQELVARLGPGLQRIAASESTRAARQRPLERPLGDYAGSYFNETYGTVSFEQRNDALAFRWGALWGPVEVFDAAKHVLRIELVGSGSTVTFRFDGPGPAKSLELQGQTFTRK